MRVRYRNSIGGLLRRGRCGLLALLAGCAACGGGATGGDASAVDGASPSDARPPGDGAHFEEGDATWPEPPCGQPVRRFTVEFPTALGQVFLRGRDRELLTAIKSREGGRLQVRRVGVIDGSVEDTELLLPEGPWGIQDIRMGAVPTVLLGLNPTTAELLWVDVLGGGTDIVELALPETMVPYAVPAAGGFVGWATSEGGSHQVLRIARSGVDAVALPLPSGSTTVTVDSHEAADQAVVMASGEGDDVHVALLGAGGPPPAGAWRRSEGWRLGQPELAVRPEGVTLTAVRDGEVEISWLDTDLVEVERTYLTMDAGVYWARPMGGPPLRAVVALRRSPDAAAHALLYGRLLDGDRLEGLRTLAELRSNRQPIAWVAPDGSHLVAAITGLTIADVFLLCGTGG